MTLLKKSLNSARLKTENPQSFFDPLLPIPYEKRLLYVDDSTYNLFVMQEIIKELDPSVTVFTALNGQLALELIADMAPHERLFDVILIDLQMPVMDGYEVSEFAWMSTLIVC